MKSFENRVCVITGAASGIGLALARQATKQKMKLVLCDIDEQALSRAHNEELKGYKQTKLLALDVTKKDSMKKLHDFAHASFGAIHLVFLNAGARGPGGNLVTEVSDDELEWIMELNQTSILRGLRTFTKSMHEGGEEGCVVVTSSIYGLGPCLNAYGVTKQAVVSLVEAFQHSLEDLGSRVRCAVLCPSFVSTDLGKRRYEKQKSHAAPEREEIINALLDNGDDAQEVAETAFAGIAARKTYIHTRLAISRALMKDRFDSVICKQTPVHRHHDEVIERLLNAGKQRRKLEHRCYVDGNHEVARL